MLFDLRGRGRRRTVKIVYITLALLMGGGLVLFGIGGGGAMSGGLVDAITGSSGGDTGSARFDKAERAAAEAWEKYLALDPPKPDDRVASLMVRAFDQTGLNRPKDAAAAQEIITEARPSATTYATLAIYAYQAGDTRKGDLARNEALQRAPKDERNTLKSSLDQAKQQALAQQIQQQQGSATPTATPKKEK